MKGVLRYPVFHVPHDGVEFPKELMESVCISKEEFVRYHEIMRDSHMADLIPYEYVPECEAAVFNISRLLCDVERFLGPEEVMERYGMGFCYEQAYDGTKIKNVTENLKKKTLKYYQKHHALIDRLCSRYSRILFIDLHSYSDEIVMKDFLRLDMDTPDVCIGTDPDYTPPELTGIVQKHFERNSYTTAINYPYSGCFIPDAVMKKKIDCDCAAIMIEINRRIFSADPDSETVSKIREIIGQIVKEAVWV